jgi:hypothetical protein
MSDLIARVPVKLRCPNGHETLVTDDNDQPQPDSPVYCTSCGAQLGRWRDVQAQALHAVGEEIKRRLRDNFGDSFRPTD